MWPKSPRMNGFIRKVNYNDKSGASGQEPLWGFVCSPLTWSSGHINNKLPNFCALSRLSEERFEHTDVGIKTLLPFISKNNSTSSKGALKYSQHTQYGGLLERRIYEEDEVRRGLALLERFAFDRGSSCTVWYPSALWSSDSQVYQHNTGGAPLCFMSLFLCLVSSVWKNKVTEVMQEGKSYRNNSLLAFSKPSFSLIGIASGTSQQVRLGEGEMEEKLINIWWMNNQSRDF